jgi:hypothetical protein
MEVVGKQKEVDHHDQREHQKQQVSHGCLPTGVTARFARKWPPFAREASLG